MVKKIRVKMNSKGARAILRSAEVQADTERRGRAIAAAAGGEPDFEVETQVGANRVRTSVRTATQKAREAEANQRALTRALDAGRS
jgi:hypothetical protein